MTARGQPLPSASGEVEDFRWPLMRRNFRRADLDAVVALLAEEDPRLTQGSRVAGFERAFADWVGVRHAVFVSSGAAANLISMMALRELRGKGEVILPAMTWVSDVASVLWCGFSPVFVDVDPETLCLQPRAVLEKLGKDTRAVFLTHALGFHGLSDPLLVALEERGIPLIEDCCEAHGASYRGRRVGSYGWLSNFSFYYAHHICTVEGGMVCTDDPALYEVLRMLRSHGLVREAGSPELRARLHAQHPDVHEGFAFAYASFNFRNTEIGATLGLAQMERIDRNVAARRENLHCFLGALDPRYFKTDFRAEGNSSYALPLVLREPDPARWRDVVRHLREQRIEVRLGMVGGGNQLRQPYLRRALPGVAPEDFPVTEHLHHFGLYLGNFPGLDREEILGLCESLRQVAGG